MASSELRAKRESINSRTLRHVSSRVYKTTNGDPELVEYIVGEMTRLERDVEARRRWTLGVQEPPVAIASGQSSTKRKKTIYERMAKRKLVNSRKRITYYGLRYEP